jgi:protein phosphatase 1 regulatory subunit 42
MISDISDIQTAMLGMVNLLNFDLRGNPVIDTEKYRDKVIMMSSSLQAINDKKILLHEREFIKELYKRKMTTK